MHRFTVTSSIIDDYVFNLQYRQLPRCRLFGPGTNPISLLNHPVTVLLLLVILVAVTVFKKA